MSKKRKAKRIRRRNTKPRLSQHDHEIYKAVVLSILNDSKKTTKEKISAIEGFYI